MDIPSLTIIDLISQTKDASRYTNFPVALINDHVVRVSVMTEPFYWHLHPNSDEIFLVIEGSVFIDLEAATITLFPGQLFAVPKNTKHRTRPNGQRSVNLTFESQHMETVKVND